ncbi:unnamed protein product [Schistocephalus solidus]|uniref:Retrotransposon gag domain-containing protein n=1 Tax=Schistocephalus solidus TaxID=70667 RepID=A0A183TD21_SCHSO|nr:unnamed protein product [Schistocephalus solidus]
MSLDMNESQQQDKSEMDESLQSPHYWTVKHHPPYQRLIPKPQTSHTQNHPTHMTDNRTDPLLVPDAFQPGQNLQEWLIKLFLFLADVSSSNHIHYMLIFLSPPTRKLALTAAVHINTPFPTAIAMISTLFDNQLSPGTANQCFANLSQTRNQSVDDFARELGRLASLAFPNLPQVDRDELILHHFVTRLLDRTVTNIFVLHPPPGLAAAIRQCKRYDDFQTHADVQSIPCRVSNTLPDVPADRLVKCQSGFRTTARVVNIVLPSDTEPVAADTTPTVSLYTLSLLAPRLPQYFHHLP